MALSLKGGYTVGLEGAVGKSLEIANLASAEDHRISHGSIDRKLTYTASKKALDSSPFGGKAFPSNLPSGIKERKKRKKKRVGQKFHRLNSLLFVLIKYLSNASITISL